MGELPPTDHIFRHIKKTWMDGDFVDPAAFRLRKDRETSRLEAGLSVNWYEYFEMPTFVEAIAPLREILLRKGRAVGGESRFALLNVQSAKQAASKYTVISVMFDKKEDDPSHSLIKNYHAFNDEVAEELAKVVIDTYSARAVGCVQAEIIKPLYSESLFRIRGQAGTASHYGRIGRRRLLVCRKS